jgi:flagellar motor switch/type III secretory pathway protein FliN
MSTAAAPARGTFAGDASGRDLDAVLCGDESRWRPVMDLPCQLSVDVPLPDFKVRDFLGVRIGSVIRTNWSLGRDVPLRVNGTLIAWAELEGTSTHLAVRMTELAESEDTWKQG